jgi:hypothetical protein
VRDTPSCFFVLLFAFSLKASVSGFPCPLFNDKRLISMAGQRRDSSGHGEKECNAKRREPPAGRSTGRNPQASARRMSANSLSVCDVCSVYVLCVAAASSSGGGASASGSYESSSGIEAVGTFDGMGLKEELLRGIYAYGQGPQKHTQRTGGDKAREGERESRGTDVANFCSSSVCVLAPGFEKPSAIQQRAIIPILKGRDVIAQSQSGTGKTTIFSIGVLQSINTRSRDTQALVLSPTRELAVQSRNVMMAFGDYMKVSGDKLAEFLLPKPVEETPQ